jgi:hypothetical protein
MSAILMLMIFVHCDADIFAHGYRVDYFRTSRLTEPARRPAMPLPFWSLAQRA